MKRILAAILIAMFLSGCASSGSKVVMGISADGKLTSIEATGDTLTSYDPATGKMEILTEAVKAETLEAINANTSQLWKLLGTP